MSKGCAFCGGTFVMCFQVSCDRCGKAGCSNSFQTEEGEEWECPACNEEENAGERTEAGR